MMGYRKGEVQLLALFKEFDADRSGFITPMELKRGFAVYGKKLTHKEVQNLFAEVDQDGDGKINFEEFVKLMQD
jgi:calmodulin